MADVAACNFAYSQSPAFSQMRGPGLLPSNIAAKRNVDTDQDPLVESSIAPKVRRTAVMHSVHDVGTAMHSLTLSTNPMSLDSSNVATNCTSARTTSRGSHSIDSVDCEPQLSHADGERIPYFQPGESLVGDEDDVFGNSGPISDQGMLMDSAMFADRVSACSRICVAENSVLSVSKMFGSGSTSFLEDRLPGDGSYGALIIYRRDIPRPSHDSLLSNLRISFSVLIFILQSSC
jgi:hypothetical protein